MDREDYILRASTYERYLRAIRTAMMEAKGDFCASEEFVKSLAGVMGMLAWYEAADEEAAK